MPDYRFGPSACPPDNTAWQERYDEAADGLADAINTLQRMTTVVPRWTPLRELGVRQQMRLVQSALDTLLAVVNE